MERETMNEKYNVPSESEKGLLDAIVDLRTCLKEANTKFVGQLTTLLFGDGLLFDPVRLVPDEDLVHSLRGVLLDVGVPGADVWGIDEAILQGGS